MTRVRVIGDTGGRYLLTLIFVVVALLPLQNNILSRLLPSAGVWLDWSFLFGVLLVGFYLWVFLKRKVILSGRAVFISVLLTGVFVLAAISGLMRPDPFSLNQFVVLVWSVPLFVFYMRDVAWRVSFLIGLVAVLLLHAQWGVVQFVVQHDLGLQLLGESLIAADLDGVAKFTGVNGKLVRAYGPYSHSNSFGGALVVGLLLLSSLLRQKVFISLKYSRLFVLLASGLLSLGILLSFSRAAYLGFGIWLALNFTLFHKDAWVLSLLKRVLLFSLLLFIIFFPMLHGRFIDKEDVAISERLSGLTLATIIIGSNPITRGVGIGGYIPSLRILVLNTDVILDDWQLAPVHSVPILMLAELGLVVSLVLFLWFLRFVWNLGVSGVLVVSLLPMLLLDHYFYSQTSLGLWFVIGMVSLVMLHETRS